MKKILSKCFCTVLTALMLMTAFEISCAAASFLPTDYEGRAVSLNEDFKDTKWKLESNSAATLVKINDGMLSFDTAGDPNAVNKTAVASRVNSGYSFTPNLFGRNFELDFTMRVNKFRNSGETVKITIKNYIYETTLYFEKDGVYYFDGTGKILGKEMTLDNEWHSYKIVVKNMQADVYSDGLKLFDFYVSEGEEKFDIIISTTSAAEQDTASFDIDCMKVYNLTDGYFISDKVGVDRKYYASEDIEITDNVNDGIIPYGVSKKASLKNSASGSLIYKIPDNCKITGFDAGILFRPTSVYAVSYTYSSDGENWAPQRAVNDSRSAYLNEGFLREHYLSDDSAIPETAKFIKFTVTIDREKSGDTADFLNMNIYYIPVSGAITANKATAYPKAEQNPETYLTVYNDTFDTAITACRTSFYWNWWRRFEETESVDATIGKAAVLNSDGTVTLSTDNANDYRQKVALGKAIPGYNHGDFYNVIDYGSDYEFNTRLKIDDFADSNAYSAQIFLNDKSNSVVAEIFEDKMTVTTADGVNNIIFKANLDNSYHNYKLKVNNASVTIYLDDENLGSFDMAAATSAEDCDTMISTSSSAAKNGKITIDDMSLVTKHIGKIITELQPYSASAALTDVKNITGYDYSFGYNKTYNFSSSSDSIEYRLGGGKVPTGFRLYGSFARDFAINSLIIEISDGINKSVINYENSIKKIFYSSKSWYVTIGREVFDEFYNTYKALPQIIRVKYGTTTDILSVTGMNVEYEDAGVINMPSVTFKTAGDTVYAETLIKNNTQDVKNYSFITVVYKDNKLVAFDTTEGTLGKTGMESVLSNVLPYSDGCEIQSFIWDNEDGLRPLCAAVAVSN